tara:strand:+ start:123 stop:662 length:540 start_codon:yes stop_codon:yes gene_type:complete
MNKVNVNGEKLFGFEDAEVVVQDWWDMFMFPENPLFKQGVVQLLAKYPDEVVRKAMRPITLVLKPKYLPTLLILKNELDLCLQNQKNEHRSENVLAKFANAEEGGINQQLYFKGIRGLLRKLKTGAITKAEYYEKQGKWFEGKNMKEDATYMYEMRDRALKGLPNIHPEEWVEGMGEAI